jgi:4-diphosphocytidyl-2C-methyl-D-erythritol kinase
MWVVLVVPNVPPQEDKTARMYRRLKTSHYADGSITERLVEIVKGRGQFDTVMLFNTFENVAFKDNHLKKYKEHLIKLGAPHVHLAGSGPALFAMFEDGEQAQDLYTRCKDQKMCVYLTRTNIA